MKNHIPPQREGAESIAVSNLELENDNEAKIHFELVKKRFNDINSWELVAGKEKAEFSLRDQNGELILRKPEVGDFVSIKVPFLPNCDEGGLDWVRVEVCETELKENFESVYIRLRPTSNPTTADDKITHFLDSSSTSNFLITRDKNIISAEVYARNEVPNSKDRTIIEKVRNKAVALGGMLIGSKLQWEGLTSGLIKDEK